MIIETGTTEELVRRAVIGGGGLRVEAAHRPTEELVLIASTANSVGGQVTFFGLEPRPLHELLRIVAAGGLWQGRISSVSPG